MRAGMRGANRGRNCRDPNGHVPGQESPVKGYDEKLESWLV